MVSQKVTIKITGLNKHSLFRLQEKPALTEAGFFIKEKNGTGYI
jgi:hypothetical protein